jgi:nucleotide-binding universal stress UspA family protein
MELIVDGSPSPLAADKQPILVPVDFSSCSSNALLFAGKFASCVGAPLLVLHVVHDQNRKPGLYSNNRGRMSMRPMIDIAADMLDEFIDGVRQQDSATDALATARTLLVNGLPAQRIGEVALRENAALVVMGTHGRSGLSRLASGSVAAEVVLRSPIPVTVVKAPPAGRQNAETVSSQQWWDRRGEPGSPESHQGMAV